jgi:hypothetical protein
MAESTNERRIHLSGLWLNESKGGEKYFSGSMGSNGKILIFKNGHKAKDSDPDYNLYLVPKPPKDQPKEQTPDGDVPF